METENIGPVAPPRRRRKSKLKERKESFEVVSGEPVAALTEESAPRQSFNSLSDSQPMKSLASDQLKPVDGEELSSTATVSVSTSLSCENLGEISSDRAACGGNECEATTRSVPVKSESFKRTQIRANDIQEAMKKRRKPPPPFDPLMLPSSSKIVQLSRSMMTVSSSNSKTGNSGSSCSVEDLSFSGSYSESTELKPVGPTQKPSRPMPPKRPIKEPSAPCPSGENLSSAKALQLAYSSKNGPGGNQSTSKSVQEDNFTIINSRRKLFERERSGEEANAKRSVGSPTSRSFRPSHAREHPDNEIQTTVSSSVFSKAQSLLSKMKANTLPRSGSSSAQRKPSSHLPPEKPPRPYLPSASGPIYETIKDAISSIPSQPASGDLYAYVDVSPRWKNKHLSSSQKWSPVIPSKCG